MKGRFYPYAEARIMDDRSLSPVERMRRLIEAHGREVIAEHGEDEWERRVRNALNAAGKLPDGEVQP